MGPDERFAAKRSNEMTRLSAAFLNNLAVGTIIAGVLSPLASGRSTPVWSEVILFLVAAARHSFARLVVHRLFKPEE